MPLQGSYQTRIYYFIIWKKTSSFFPLSFGKIQELIKKSIANERIFEYSIQRVNVFFFLRRKNIHPDGKFFPYCIFQKYTKQFHFRFKIFYNFLL